MIMIMKNGQNGKRKEGKFKGKIKEKGNEREEDEFELRLGTKWKPWSSSLVSSG